MGIEIIILLFSLLALAFSLFGLARLYGYRIKRQEATLILHPGDKLIIFLEGELNGKQEDELRSSLMDSLSNSGLITVISGTLKPRFQILRGMDSQTEAVPDKKI